MVGGSTGDRLRLRMCVVCVWLVCVCVQNTLWRGASCHSPPPGHDVCSWKQGPENKQDTETQPTHHTTAHTCKEVILEAAMFLSSHSHSLRLNECLYLEPGGPRPPLYPIKWNILFCIFMACLSNSPSSFPLLSQEFPPCYYIIFLAIRPLSRHLHLAHQGLLESFREIPTVGA